jgi:16S rRNA (guanine527-N7)-methyltransferase
MVSAELIFQHFPNLSPEQKQKFEALFPLYSDLNSKINVISRKDMDNFYIHHVLHSLALVKFCDFGGLKTVVDIGTGGGFPGIPLAILYPEIEFSLVDSIGKKITVVQTVAKEIGLDNVDARNARVESLPNKFDLAVARAVAQSIELYQWMQQHWKSKPLFYLLKGGDLTEEMNNLLQLNSRLKIQSHRIADVFSEEFFETKKVITISQ